jgi:hypothetical protein
MFENEEVRKIHGLKADKVSMGFRILYTVIYTSDAIFLR